MPPLSLEAAALPSLMTLASALSIGLLMGLERERRQSARAGLRTFALTGLLGALCAGIAERLAFPWLVGFSLVGVALIIVGAYHNQAASEEPGTTTEVALLLCFALGVLCWLGERALAAMIGIAATVLLNFKVELSGLARRLSERDMRAMLQFAVLSLVILPVLPNRDMGPYAAFNPYQTWLMVVLISGVGLAGYLALSVLGERHGGRLLGVLGGLVSSTATTLVYARTARARPDSQFFAATVVVLAHLTVLARLTLIGVVAAPAITPNLAPVMLVGLAAGLLAAWPLWGRKLDETAPSHVANPTELKTAVGFAAAYSVVLLAAAWLNDLAGQGGLYLVAAASGTTDVDAITLSSLRLFSQTRLAADQAVYAVVIAVSTNTLFKLGLAGSVGGWRFARTVAGPMLAATSACVLAAWLVLV